MRKLARIPAALAAALAAACGGGSTPSSGGGGENKVVLPPIVDGSFTYHSVDQGLPPDVRDVSADEGGNVYVAATTAVLAKKRGDATFRRFEPAAAGLTRNCDAAGTVSCPIVSIAGAAPGVAVVGLQGIGTDGDADPDWQLSSGGADVVAFDVEKLTRTRHVELAGPPHRMCEDHSEPPCAIGDATYEKGRRKVRQVLRIAVNHARGTVHSGDVWFAGTHGSFSLLVANPGQRGWRDLTPDFPGTEDRRYVWEHDHPAMYAPATIGGVKQWAYLTGQSTAIAIDPTTGDPWASNETRTARKHGYGAVADGWDAPMWPWYDPVDERRSWLDVWPDPLPTDPWQYDALDPAHLDAVTSLSFCDDGTLWIASALHGLARRAPDGRLSYVDLPPGLGNNASAVACDPSDGSVWVGFGWGGFGRYDGGWWRPDGARAPAFALHGPVGNIQLDRWASPRIVYVAHVASRAGPGGVTAYQGD
jgi:hypothetical protein